MCRRRNYALCLRTLFLPRPISDYATLLNSEAKGVSAGRIEPDAFLQRELEHAYAAARDSAPTTASR